MIRCCQAGARLGSQGCRHRAAAAAGVAAGGGSSSRSRKSATFLAEGRSTRLRENCRAAGVLGRTFYALAAPPSLSEGLPSEGGSRLRGWSSAGARQGGGWGRGKQQPLGAAGAGRAGGGGGCPVVHVRGKHKKNDGPKQDSADPDEEYDSVDDVVDLEEVRQRYERVLQGLLTELRSLRGGRVDASMFEHISVEAYGSSVAMGEVAQLAVKGPQLIVAQVYDPSLTTAVSDAIRDDSARTGLSLNPTIEGNTVGIKIPKMAKDTREALAKVVGKQGEQARVHLRGITNKVEKKLRSHESLFGKDDVFRKKKDIEELAKAFDGKVVSAAKSKKEELMTV